MTKHTLGAAAREDSRNEYSKQTQTPSYTRRASKNISTCEHVHAHACVCACGVRMHVPIRGSPGSLSEPGYQVPTKRLVQMHSPFRGGRMFAQIYWRSTFQKSETVIKPKRKGGGGPRPQRKKESSDLRAVQVAFRDFNS